LAELSLNTLNADWAQKLEKVIPDQPKNEVPVQLRAKPTFANMHTIGTPFVAEGSREGGASGSTGISKQTQAS
jgi:hypothetical protein